MTETFNGKKWCGECVYAYDHMTDKDSPCYTCKEKRNFKFNEQSRPSYESLKMFKQLSDEFYLLLVDDPNTKLKADQIMVNIFGKCEPSPSEVSTTQDVLMDIKKDDTCPVCAGSGQVAGAYFSEDGITTCDRCNGKGTI